MSKSCVGVGGPSPPPPLPPPPSIIIIDADLQLPSAFRPAAENCDDMPMCDDADAATEADDAAAAADELSECASAAGIAYSCGTVMPDAELLLWCR